MMIRMTIAAAAILFAGFAVPNAEERPLIDPASPFRLGEGYPETPATCATVGDWIDKAPIYEGRISMTIVGSIVESHWDGALAYLVMCEAPGVQVMCVTYAPRDANSGVSFMMAGGFQRISEDKIILDPCLAEEG